MQLYVRASERTSASVRARAQSYPCARANDSEACDRRGSRFEVHRIIKRLRGTDDRLRIPRCLRSPSVRTVFRYGDSNGRGSLEIEIEIFRKLTKRPDFTSSRCIYSLFEFHSIRDLLDLDLGSLGPSTVTLMAFV